MEIGIEDTDQAIPEAMLTWVMPMSFLIYKTNASLVTICLRCQRNTQEGSLDAKVR